MTTPIPAQTTQLVAKDILIAAITTGKLIFGAPTIEGQGENLAKIYNAILSGIENAE